MCVWCVCVDNLFSLNSVRFGKQALTEAAVSQQGFVHRQLLAAEQSDVSFHFLMLKALGQRGFETFNTQVSQPCIC